MLSLLTDEQISPVVAEQIRARRPDITIQSIHHWRDGIFLGNEDPRIISAAHEDRLTLITYDQKTISPLLVELVIAEKSHSGIVFVDASTISSNDIGGLVRAIIAFYDRCQEWDWTNRISFLDAQPAY